MEFKVGDKLKCIALPAGGSKAWYTIGNVYEIVGKDEQTNQFVITCDSNKFKIAFERSCIEKLFQRIDEPQLTKVKLTQEQAVALESVMKDNDIECVITAHAEPGEWMTDESRALNGLSVADLARAVLIGYEVEQTPEQKVFKRWEKSVTSFNTAVFKEGLGVTTAFEHGYQNGMKSVLKVYGITVKGIND